MATEQDTEQWIFGSGFDTYPWWGRPSANFDEVEVAPDGWEWTVRYNHPDDDPDDVPRRARIVTHEDIMRAVRSIADGKVEYAEDDLRRECRKAQFRPDEVDLDSHDADNILQVAVLGYIFYV